MRRCLLSPSTFCNVFINVLFSHLRDGDGGRAASLHFSFSLLTEETELHDSIYRSLTVPGLVESRKRFQTEHA